MVSKQLAKLLEHVHDGWQLAVALRCLHAVILEDMQCMRKSPAYVYLRHFIDILLDHLLILILRRRRTLEQLLLNQRRHAYDRGKYLLLFCRQNFLSLCITIVNAGRQFSWPVPKGQNSVHGVNVMKCKHVVSSLAPGSSTIHLKKHYVKTVIQTRRYLNIVRHDGRSRTYICNRGRFCPDQWMRLH